MASRGPTRFREVQRFGRNPLVAIAALGLVAACVGMAWQGLAGDGFGPASAILLLVLVALGFLLGFGELRTEVRDDALYVRMFPLTREHRFAWDDIRSCAARSYRPLREYGGWGVRWGPSGRAYNVRGHRGVQLELADGKRLLIGSQRADELAAVIDEARSTRSRAASGATAGSDRPVA